jgi:hypothetical protein
MNIGDRFVCLFCLSNDGFTLRLDKKNRPFFSCTACGINVFPRGGVSLKGPTILWGPLGLALRAKDGEAARNLVTQAAEVAAHA